VSAAPIYIKGEQGTTRWHQLRYGVVSASKFGNVVAADKEGKPRLVKPKGLVSPYALELACARLTHGVVLGDGYTSKEMERGNELEPQARQEYELMNEPVDEWAFIYRDEAKRIGCSPDGTIGDDGGLEIKCPFVKRLMEMSFGGERVDKAHLPQIQGCMWVTKRSWWDYKVYCPERDGNFPSWTVRVERDPDWMAAFDEHIVGFNEKVDEIADWRGR